MYWFQSAPVIADGRTPRSPRSIGSSSGSFNPRPSSLTGEPMPAAEAMPPVNQFQSAPVIADGRTPGYISLIVRRKLWKHI